MKTTRPLLFLLGTAAVATAAEAALYWGFGVQPSNRPTVCFVGDATTGRPQRVAEIQLALRWFEEAANIRFQYVGACLSKPLAPGGNDRFTADIRIVIPQTAWGAVTDVYDAVNPIPGKGCDLTEGGGGWANPPSEVEAKRACLFNVHLGDDSFATAEYVFGQPSTDGRPFLNHTLHEVGHALGLSHEHARFDVPESWVLHYLQQIPGVGATEAKRIYDAGFRAVASVAGSDKPEDLAADIAKLQAIKGYEKEAAAAALKKAAQSVNQSAVQFGGGEQAYLTPYDRLSVMHYTWKEMASFAPGNYAHTGLSEWDRLALHILYPENQRVAEIAGTRVLPVGGRLRLALVWELRGAVMPKVARNHSWKLGGTVHSTGTVLDRIMTQPGTYPLEVRFDDLLGRSYLYQGEVRVLDAAQHRRLVAPLAAQLPLL